MSLWNKSHHKASSRKQIQIKEVRDGILILPKHTYSLVIETSAVNFELKSEAEQDVIIDSFQHFLNSLPSNIQMLIRVREVDIDRYLETFMKNKDKELEEIYREQITSYCQFIQNLVKGNKILSRRFYLIMSYVHQEGKQDFSFVKEQLHLNRDIVVKGLEKLGMKAKELNSLEVLDLFYHFYNPTEAKLQSLTTQSITETQPNAYV